MSYLLVFIGFGPFNSFSWTAPGAVPGATAVFRRTELLLGRRVRSEGTWRTAPPGGFLPPRRVLASSTAPPSSFSLSSRGMAVYCFIFTRILKFTARFVGRIFRFIFRRKNLEDKRKYYVVMILYSQYSGYYDKQITNFVGA